MTGPRIYPDNTAVSRTPRATKGPLDMLRSILLKGQQGVEAVDRRIASGLPEGTRLLGMPDYVSGPRGLARGLSPLARAALQRDEALAQLEKSDLPEVLRLRSEAGIHTLYEQLVAKINALNVKYGP